MKSSLDLLTSTLVTFEDAADLEHKIASLYTHIDTDGSGGLNYDEVRKWDCIGVLGGGWRWLVVSY